MTDNVNVDTPHGGTEDHPPIQDRKRKSNPYTTWSKAKKAVDVARRASERKDRLREQAERAKAAADEAAEKLKAAEAAEREARQALEESMAGEREAQADDLVEGDGDEVYDDDE